MFDVLKKGQHLLQKAEKQNTDPEVAAILADFHELAGQAIKDHGKKVGLSDVQIAAIVIPKKPK